MESLPSQSNQDADASPLQARDEAFERWVDEFMLARQGHQPKRFGAVPDPDSIVPIHLTIQEVAESLERIRQADPNPEPYDYVEGEPF